jgi:hypothetical protein
MNLYNNVEQADVLLESAYYYGIRIFMTVGLASVAYTLLSLLTSRILKYNSLKFSTVFFIGAAVCLAVILSLDFTVGSNISLYRFFVVLNLVLSIGLVGSYSVCSYINSRKTNNITGKHGP